MRVKQIKGLVFQSEKSFINWLNSNRGLWLQLEHESANSSYWSMYNGDGELIYTAIVDKYNGGNK